MKININLIIKGKKVWFPLVQGGMGSGVSMYPLAIAVAIEGSVGVISTACIDRLISKRLGRKVDTYEAVVYEVSLAKSLAPGGLIGVNIMCALRQDYEMAVRGAIDAKADFIISGAGLPLSLPLIQNPGDTALIPIVSSLQVANIICNRWERNGYRPDAMIIEGPEAGGHVTFSLDQINNPNFSLENLLPPIKDFAMKNGDFPIGVAGGIWNSADMLRFSNLGADFFQLGTRFMATVESSASPAYKQAVLNAKREDIVVATMPGSPCGYPFRVIKGAPLTILNPALEPPCNKGYLLQPDASGHLTACKAKTERDKYFCICNGLLASAGYSPEEYFSLYTAGSNAWRVNEIVTAKAVIDELKQGLT
jgi:nitronate monooxygenase